MPLTEEQELTAVELLVRLLTRTLDHTPDRMTMLPKNNINLSWAVTVTFTCQDTPRAILADVVAGFLFAAKVQEFAVGPFYEAPLPAEIVNPLFARQAEVKTDIEALLTAMPLSPETQWVVERILEQRPMLALGLEMFSLLEEGALTHMMTLSGPG